MERQDELPIDYEKPKEQSVMEKLEAMTSAERFELRLSIRAKKDELDDLLSKLTDLSELESW